MFEQSLPLVLLGVIVTALLAGVWMQTGKRPLLYGAIVMVTITILLVAVERLVVTDREAVEVTLNQIAFDVEQNNVEAVVAHIHPAAAETIAQVRGELPRYLFTDVTIKSNLEITVDSDQSPPQATAQFNASVTVTERHGLIANQRVPRFVIVTLEKDRDGKWKVRHYEHREPQLGFLQPGESR